MKKQSLNSLGLNKKSISSLNLIGGAVGASSNQSGQTVCFSCTRSCIPCRITEADQDRCNRNA